MILAFRHAIPVVAATVQVATPVGGSGVILGTGRDRPARIA